MNSNTFDRLSFLSFLLTVALVPIFFLPFSRIPIETSKSLLVVLGLAITAVFWAMARFFDGKLVLPKSYALFSALGLTVVALLSSLFSPAIKWSLFGTMLDTGSFFFIFACFLFLLLGALFFRDTVRGGILLWTLALSFTVVLGFQILRLMFPEILALGMASGKMANLIGSWNALAIFAGLAALLSLFSFEFLSLSQVKKWVFVALLALSLIFLIIIAFPLVWGLLAVFALVIFVVKVLFYVREKQTMANREASKVRFPLAPLIVIVLSIVFFMAGPGAQSYVPTKLGVLNSEVRPSTGSTAWVAKQTLKTSPLLGAGPNRFSEMWALHKPEKVNESQFWNINFDFGAGTIPTFVITFGGIGILFWLLFFGFFVWTGGKSVFASIKTGSNYGPTAFFLASLYLMIASVLYPAGPVLLFLAFALAGVFIGLHSKETGREARVSFLENPKKSFVAIIFLVLFIISAVVLSFKFVERFAGVIYYTRALSAATVPEAEAAISKAVSLNTNDLFLRTQSQVYLARLNSEAEANPEPTPEKIIELQGVFNGAVNSAVAATVFNHTNYLNFQALGIVYETAGSLGVASSYEKALEAYRAAGNLSPTNPGIKLALARTYLVLKQPVEAKEYGRLAFTLKPNYVEALIFLSQLANAEGDIEAARSYAERALSFAPGNQEIINYINSLSASGRTPANDVAP